MKYLFPSRTQRAFTLAEVLVVVSIIALLASVALVSMSQVRASANDKRRVADLAQIQLALKLYQTQNGTYPKESSGYSGSANVGEICSTCSGPINAEIQKYLGSVPEDPKHDGSTYRYYYDAKVNCGGSTDKAILFARTMETGKYKNQSQFVCSSWGTEGGSKTNAYIIFLGESPG